MVSQLLLRYMPIYCWSLTARRSSRTTIEIDISARRPARKTVTIAPNTSHEALVLLRHADSMPANFELAAEDQKPLELRVDRSKTAEEVCKEK